MRPMARLGAMVAALALVLSAAGCGSSAPATPAPWPTGAQVKDQLTSKFHYTFVPYQDTYRSANASLELQISVLNDLTTTREMRVAVYNTSYTKYTQDIDNVFSVIAPDALQWAHNEEKKGSSNAGFQENYDSLNGVITCLWTASVPMLVFVFNG